MLLIFRKKSYTYRRLCSKPCGIITEYRDGTRNINSLVAVISTSTLFLILISKLKKYLQVENKICRI